jgi:hypothetical protein
MRADWQPDRTLRLVADRRRITAAGIRRAMRPRKRLNRRRFSQVMVTAVVVAFYLSVVFFGKWGLQP